MVVIGASTFSLAPLAPAPSGFASQARAAASTVVAPLAAAVATQQSMAAQAMRAFGATPTANPSPTQVAQSAAAQSAANALRAPSSSLLPHTALFPAGGSSSATTPAPSSSWSGGSPSGMPPPQSATNEPLGPAVSAPVASGAQGVVRVLQPPPSDMGPASPPVLTVDHPSVSDPAQVTPVAQLTPAGVSATRAATTPDVTTGDSSSTYLLAAVGGLLIGTAIYFWRKR